MPETIDVTPSGSASERPPERDVTASIPLGHVLYALHALAPFTMWLLAILALIIAMVKKDDVRGTWLESHFTWLGSTFWWGLLWLVITIIGLVIFGLVTLGLGFFLAWLFFLPVTLWYWYRLIKGWLKLNDGKSVA